MKKGSLIRIRESITTPGDWVGRLAVVVKRLRRRKSEPLNRQYYAYVRFLDTGHEVSLYKNEMEALPDV